MEKLSVVIITKNEQNNIRRCLEGVKWADEIVVVDTGSTDRTVALCREAGLTPLRIKWQGFGQAKHFAVEQARNDWVLSIDADEVVTAELRQEIRQALTQPLFMAFRLKLKTFYVKRWIKHSGWANEYHLRLFNRRFGNYNLNPVHESVETSVKVGKLQAALLHYSYPDFATYLRKMESYTQLSVRQKAGTGNKASLFTAIGHGLLTFIRMYFFKAGFLDGSVGLALAINSAFAVYMKYLMLWEQQTPNKEG